MQYKNGNRTAKSFFKTRKKGISQRVNEIRASLHTTPKTSGEFLSSEAKIPTIFEINENENIADKTWVQTTYNENAPANTKAPADGTHGSTAVAPGTSSAAKLATMSEIGELSYENVSDDGRMFCNGEIPGISESDIRVWMADADGN